MEQKRIYEQVGVAMTSRTYAEYERMFMLDDKNLLGKRVLDVAGGASSFTAEARRKGVLSEAADPLFNKSAKEITEHGMQEIEAVAAKMEKLVDVYNWEFYGSVEQHRAGRVEGLRLFAEDFASPVAKSRYHGSLLPNLPFEDDTFDLVLCSHFLFLYEDQFDYAFHLAAVRELLRICKPGGEVRAYPLLNFRTEEYTRLQDLLDELTLSGYLAEKRKSNLPFLPNSEQFIIIAKPDCA
ncbi:methyltransferase domain-containing protein [Paenibacillus sedimenti]|uniref:Methyltransferase domain-containing protein n=1 Tax=Paenibacillus sedimenti TaxID=2770274 RepID=A0A926QIY2_9BACL|nr:methyltransferase domain-containing protein [Paenibacillus sedimenti]MBD0381146.1 methyltransferase domain-containing protein [Paenibacillus sedimenti]